VFGDEGVGVGGGGLESREIVEGTGVAEGDADVAEEGWAFDAFDGAFGEEGAEGLVVEGEKIVGETPRLAPGEQFSYNSYHVTGTSARATGSFHGVDELGRKIHVLLPAFELMVPASANPAA
jgi:hypothetical protein